MRNKICCPICRAICCIFNEKDTCCKFIPSDAPGYDCPDFLKEEDTDDDIPIVFFELSGVVPGKVARG